MNPTQAEEILELAEGGDLRAAYLAQVKKFPPETHAERFQEVRAAYELLKDERAPWRLHWAKPAASLCDLLKDPAARPFVGAQAWREALCKP